MNSSSFDTGISAGCFATTRPPAGGTPYTVNTTVSPDPTAQRSVQDRHVTVSQVRAIRYQTKVTTVIDNPTAIVVIDDLGTAERRTTRTR